MLANFLIGLREGLEASLIVSILVAYLVKSKRRHEIRYVWIGVSSALVLVVAVFSAINVAFDQLSFKTQEIVGGTMSILAAGLVTWMIFWMRRTARSLKSELEGQMSAALGPFALATVAFVTVGREGLETAAIIWSTIKGSTTAQPFVGATGGILVAVILGFLIYRGAIRINLSTFFTITGALLIIVAAGVLAYGIFDLQEARVLPGFSDRVFDISSTIPPDSWYGTLLKGTINFQPDPSWLQVIAWVGYLVPVLWLYLRKPKPAAAKPEPASVTAG
ncbi:high-affinity iron transporter [Aeromicrobium panaciterrae]|uniref:High-affinity iron transporter n=1 Tax=Aeromicrobium panaciterrae TaxID=363861 RepID=A0ABU1UNA0_9ACTN|nr:iron uptake transporter permease EfeU [Aeromicrobium panaciterrae]MDR7086670.1 high-affinity iron transporter [Aeromicrobium panaciterrae]